MHSKKNHWINMIELIIIFLMFIISCEKDDIGNVTNGKTKAVFNDQLVYGSMTDQEGNIYKTITIGTQTWMAENIRTTIFRNGEPIEEVSIDSIWLNALNGAFCNYNDTKNIDTIATYGRLYNWYAVSDSRSIAPVGWHVPTKDELKILTNYLGGYTIAGNKLKEVDTTHWNAYSYSEATNESGFTALPGGARGGGEFSGIGHFCNLSSSTEDSKTGAWRLTLNYGSVADFVTSHKVIGQSVRCVKD